MDKYNINILKQRDKKEYILYNKYLQIQSSCMSIIYLISRDMKIKFNYVLYCSIYYVLILFK